LEPFGGPFPAEGLFRGLAGLPERFEARSAKFDDWLALQESVASFLERQNPGLKTPSFRLQQIGLNQQQKTSHVERLLL
jgi:hypothetical protein